jgi:hypothetical protein
MKRFSKIAGALIVAVAFVLGFSAESRADFTGVGTDGRSAKASFSISGGDLILVLTNLDANSALPAPDATHVLTGLFFNISGNPSLSPTSVTASDLVANGQTGPGPSHTPVGGGTNVAVTGAWAYKNTAGLYSGYNYGVSATGLAGIFGSGDIVAGASPVPGQQGTAPDGLDFGVISSAMDNSTTLNNDGIATTAVIDDHVTIDLGAFSGSPNAITAVLFQYGTAQADASIPVLNPNASVPEPSKAIALSGLFGLGLVGLVCNRLRQRPVA